MEKEADLSDRPALSSTYVLPVFNIDLASDGKQSYGFTPANKLKEVEEVEKDVKQMLDAGCLRPYVYTDLVPNVVLTKKKDGQWRVAIDVRNLNGTTLPDE
jgi:hypothetical protein